MVIFHCKKVSWRLLHLSGFLIWRDDEWKVMGWQMTPGSGQLDELVGPWSEMLLSWHGQQPAIKLSLIFTYLCVWEQLMRLPW